MVFLINTDSNTNPFKISFQVELPTVRFFLTASYWLERFLWLFRRRDAHASDRIVIVVTFITGMSEYDVTSENSEEISRMRGFRISTSFWYDPGLRIDLQLKLHYFEDMAIPLYF